MAQQVNQLAWVDEAADRGADKAIAEKRAWEERSCGAEAKAEEGIVSEPHMNKGGKPNNVSDPYALSLDSMGKGRAEIRQESAELDRAGNSGGQGVGLSEVGETENAERLHFPVVSQIPGAGTSAEMDEYERRNGNVVGTDRAKLLFDGYDQTDPESQRKYHRRASELVHGVFLRYLETRKGGGNGMVVFMGGGNGAGKSTISDEAAKVADFAFDSTMASLDAARESIRQVVDNEERPVLIYVYRDPKAAWEAIKGRVARGGHTASVSAWANTHVNSRKVFLTLAQEFGDKINVEIRETVEDGRPRPLTIDELVAKPECTVEQLRSMRMV